MTEFPHVRLRFLAEFNPNAPLKVRASGRDFPLYSMDAINKFGTPSDPVERPVNELLSGYSYIEPTDVAYAKVTPCFENGKGMVGTTLDGPTFATTEITVLRPRPQMNQRFLARVLQSDQFRAPAIASMTGAGGLRRVSETTIRDHHMPAPPLCTQLAIADYLDHETAEIDALIADLQAVVNLSRERRLAVIDAAIDRIATDPKPLKRFGYIQPGLTLGSSYPGEKTFEYRYLRVANVQAGRIDESEIKTTSVPHRVAAATTLMEGDVLLTEGGDRDKLGRGALWQGSLETTLHQNHVFAFRCSDSLVPKFLVYTLEASYARCYFDVTARQSTNLASTNSSIVLTFPVSVPDLDEQHAIIRTLDNQQERFELEQEDLTRAIDLAKERRTALITAAVTGQIDVTARNRPAAEQLEDDIKELS